MITSPKSIHLNVRGQPSEACSHAFGSQPYSTNYTRPKIASLKRASLLGRTKRDRAKFFQPSHRLKRHGAPCAWGSSELAAAGELKRQCGAAGMGSFWEERAKWDFGRLSQEDVVSRATGLSRAPTYPAPRARAHAMFRGSARVYTSAWTESDSTLFAFRTEPLSPEWTKQARPRGSGQPPRLR
ncbi:hypothetical protein G7046_g8262 [Stylonectria norvegica]|nr:hypothetical protein G7046_g8262 [Stylonectria norvegica]